MDYRPKTLHTFVFFFLSFLLVSCGQGKRKTLSIKLENYTKQGLYKEAFDVLENKEFKENKLLYLMQKGRLHFLKKDYASAMPLFSEASELMQKQFTKKIRYMLTSSLLSDKIKEYKGHFYERLLVYYHLSWGHYFLGDVDRTRASLMAWNSYLEEMERNHPEFLHLSLDYFSTINQAIISDLLPKRSDKERAWILYRKAYQALNLQGGCMKSYNLEDHYEFCAKLTDHLEKVKKYPDLKMLNFPQTKLFKQTKKFIQAKIFTLTTTIRKSQLSQIKRQFNLGDKDFLNYYKNDYMEAYKELHEKSFIAPLEDFKVSYTLESAFDHIENDSTRKAVKAIGLTVITAFALGPLGFGTYHRVNNNTYITNRHNLGNELVGQVGFEFYMPKIDPQRPLVKETNQETFRMISLSDYADYHVNYEASLSFYKRSARIAIKYFTAILAAYTTYQAIKGKNSNFITNALVASQFVLSSKIIRETERVDTRYWTLLPSHIDFTLSKSKQDSLIDHQVDLTEMNIKTKTSTKNKMKNEKIKA